MAPSNPEEFRKIYLNYCEHAMTLLVSPTTKHPTDSDPTYESINALYYTLNFKNHFNLAYHVVKHRDEGLYSGSENPIENLKNYIKTARNCVRDATKEGINKKIELNGIPSQFNNDSMKFEFKVKHPYIDKNIIVVYLTVEKRSGLIYLNSCYSRADRS
jgi:DNA-directed RNA polymerase subunit L